MIGSFEGKLRILKPNSRGNHKYGIEDLILEQDLGVPILQVSSGYFIKTRPDKLALAILSTRFLTVYAVEST